MIYYKAPITKKARELNIIKSKKRTMSRIFITGPADGLGKMAAQLLVAEGHKVVLHARDNNRANDAMDGTPGAEAAISGDLSSIKETKKVAEKANALGAFDAVIHNLANVPIS
jgi:NAD(P)-dependent dehydrogenase (short-subunit alcohol dehydrogenase family)